VQFTRAPGLPDVVLIEPRVHEDARGFFLETYHEERFRAAGIAAPFLQDNHARSRAGVLRGLHYQQPRGQGKLVRVVDGEVFDVAVDVRAGSPTFGRWFGARLSAANRRMLWVPPGFAHGYAALSETADVLYKCTDVYHPEHEHVLLWSDPAIGIDWPLEREPALSARDAAGLTLAELERAAALPRFAP